MKLTFEVVESEAVAPVATAHGAQGARPAFHVTARCGDLTGRGVAAPWEHFGTESVAHCTSALQTLGECAVPKELTDIVEATARLSETPCARFALECALLEILARRCETRVATLLSAQACTELSLSKLVDGATDARALKAQGWQTVKLKVGLGAWEEDVARARALLEHGFQVRIDANGSWTEDIAARVLAALPGLELCEQPVAATEVAALRRLAQGHRTLVAADEALATPELRGAVRGPPFAATALVVKPAVLGGLLPALAFIASCPPVPLVVTSFFDGPLGAAAAAELACVLPQSGHAHGFPELASSAREGKLSCANPLGWGAHA